MKSKLWCTTLFFLAAGLPLPAQRASMESPVIKPEAEIIKVSTVFTDFAEGGEYRIGVGTAGADPAGIVLELTVGGKGSGATVAFTQGYTSSWWQVEQVTAKGYVFGESELNGMEATLRVQIPRELAEKAGQIFVFVAKKYGPTTWYLEDGIALGEEYW